MDCLVPLPHQVKALDAIDALLRTPSASKNFLVAGPTGCGKTLVAMGFPLPILFITKKSIVSHIYAVAMDVEHIRETKSRSGRPFSPGITEQAHPVRVIASLADMAPSGATRVYILTENAFRRSRPVDLRCRIATVVIDEAHQFSGRAAIHNLKCANTMYTVCLTATPVPTKLNKLMTDYNTVTCAWSPAAMVVQHTERWDMPGCVRTQYDAFKASVPDRSGLLLHNDFKHVWKIISLSKVPRLVSGLFRHCGDRRIVVYCMFAATVTAIMQQWYTMGGPPGLIGTTVMNSATSTQRVTILNAVTHGNGIDLHEYDMLVLIDIPNTLSKLKQVMGRLVRACMSTYPVRPKVLVPILYAHTFEEVFLREVPACCEGLL